MSEQVLEESKRDSKQFQKDNKIKKPVEPMKQIQLLKVNNSGENKE